MLLILWAIVELILMISYWFIILLGVSWVFKVVMELNIKLLKVVCVLAIPIVVMWLAFLPLSLI